MTIILALIVFLLLISFHEFGHFIAAKGSGIRVNEFSVGMGPLLWKRKKGETQYSLRALPLGGYCAMEGEDEVSTDERSFDAAKPGARFLTILAGPLMNLFIAFLCFVIYLQMVGMSTTVIDHFTDQSPFERAGAQVEDRIIGINGEKTSSFEQMREQIQAAKGQVLQVEIQRGAETKVIDVQPQERNGEYFLGFEAQRQHAFFDAIGQGFAMTVSMFGQIWHVLVALITGAISFQAVSGPVGVVKAIGDAAQLGFAPFLYFTGYLSLNLAFFNLLPIPALDGSKLLLILVEKLRGKPLNKTWEFRIMATGFVLLLALIIVVSVKDVMQLF